MSGVAEELGLPRGLGGLLGVSPTLHRAPELVAPLHFEELREMRLAIVPAFRLGEVGCAKLPVAVGAPEAGRVEDLGFDRDPLHGIGHLVALHAPAVCPGGPRTSGREGRPRPSSSCGRRRAIRAH